VQETVCQRRRQQARYRDVGRDPGGEHDEHKPGRQRGHALPPAERAMPVSATNAAKNVARRRSSVKTAIAPQGPPTPARPSSTMRNDSNASFAPTTTTSSASHHPKALVYDLTAFGRLRYSEWEVAMTRLACLRATLVASTLLAVVAARPAMASDPVGVYVAASRVDTMPSDADATSAVIHGAFMFLQADGTYTAPQCGYMYFVCAAGSETMCRMQWKDVRTISTYASQCAGFGALRVVATATLRAEGTALASPDTWDLGIGVTSGISIGGQCQPAKVLSCPLPTGSGGAGGTGTGGTGAGGTGAGGSGAGGATGGTGETTGTGGNVGTAGTGG
jgi:hypothetical protein